MQHSSSSLPLSIGLVHLSKLPALSTLSPHRNMLSNNAIRTEKWQCYCHHGRYKPHCRDCGGTGLCEHHRVPSHCGFCRGSQICRHGVRRPYCAKCKGSQMCVHGKQERYCVPCRGSEVCIHNNRRSRCPSCDPIGYHLHKLNYHLRAILKGKNTRSIGKKEPEFLGCSPADFRQWMENLLDEDNGMTMENFGTVWTYATIIPLKEGRPSLEVQFSRLHYTNWRPVITKKEQLRRKTIAAVKARQQDHQDQL